MRIYKKIEGESERLKEGRHQQQSIFRKKNLNEIHKMPRRL
jgi:hypothetical protein